MKIKSLLLSTILITLCGLAPISDDNCKVLLPNLSGSYEGDCKNGMAHGNGKAIGIDTYEGKFKKSLPEGEGTYTWENGDTSIGEWIKGLQNGLGKFKTSIDGEDTVYVGSWSKDKFVGVRTIKPKVTQQFGIDRHRFVRTDGPWNKMCIVIYQNGDYNRTIRDFMISGDSGIQMAGDQLSCFERFEIPLKCTLRYKTLNKLGSAEYYVNFEFEILQEGSREVSVYN
ncbi:MAG: hypothetical protein ACJA2S_003147 [Cyclobacteriaceae bacterium]|jgi:hypothetical protein